MSDVERTRYASRIRALAKASAVESENVETVDAGPFVALIAPALVPHRPLWRQQQELIGVGNLRLDHRDEVKRWSDIADLDVSDLDLALAAIRSRGTRCIREMLGDFAFVVWEARTQTLTAARDAFGVKTLFLGQRGRLLVLSSHLELVHESEKLDEKYVGDFLLAGDPGAERTIWADSRAVPQGSIVTARHGQLTTERFWNPYDFEPDTVCDERTKIEEFRALFREAVRVRLQPGEPTWAELSGGLDSSSVVSVAQTLVEEGITSNSIAGTISIVDELGAGDERSFSTLVTQRFNLSNTVVSNPWPWQDDGYAPPRTDEPRTHYPFFARDRLMSHTVRAAGARVLLSGMGSDHYLYGSRLFISDLITTGHPIQGIKELARWSIVEKQSFWTSLVRDGIMPLLPLAAQLPFQAAWHSMPDWIEPGFAQRLSLYRRLPAARISCAPRGQRFSWHMADAMQELVRWLPRGPFEEGIELRYPFLYRPLVELGLRLPPSMRAQPLAPKWILREAMRGILPEPIRRRSSKGAIDARIIWAFHQEQEQISELLANLSLPQLGIIRAEQLRTAVQRATRGELDSIVMLLAALSLETWLAVRSGRRAGRKQELQLRNAV